MKLYLSSYKIGNKTEELKKWIVEHNNKICLIPNSRDIYPESDRKKDNIQNDVQDLENLGFEVSILSLKDYFNKKEELYKILKKFSAFYVIGGNVFTLRQAMYLSGFDEFLKTIDNNPNYLYAGYSAGICVLSKDMHGLDICDDPNINPYGIDTIWEGLGYFDYIFLPHYKSNHKETKLIDESVEYCNKNNIKYKTLRDGEVIIEDLYNGEKEMSDSIDIVKVKIRKVEKEDLRAVSEIGVTGWQTAYRGIIDDEFLDNMSIEEFYQSRLNDYTESGFIVAEFQEEIVGFCRYRTGNYYKNEYDSVDCEICALYVKPDCKRNGIGTKLVNYVINEFKENGYVQMILWCLKDNYPSRGFYEKLGGIYCGENVIERGNKEYKEVGYLYDLKNINPID